MRSFFIQRHDIHCFYCNRSYTIEQEIFQRWRSKLRYCPNCGADFDAPMTEDVLRKNGYELAEKLS